MLIHLEVGSRKALPKRGIYNVDVTEAGQGRFTAHCQETKIEVTSANAEHDLAYVLTERGYEDGSIQTWRGSVRSLYHPSIHRMGMFRIAPGDEFPRRVRRRKNTPDLGGEVGQADHRSPVTMSGLSETSREQSPVPAGMSRL